MEGILGCHRKPDWLLIWKQDQDNLYLIRTGTHSDLY
ncbi:MAG TPA: type II toxin-antitoxin system YafQ family toxin [Candidatus Marinimicrobia bacterium]|nr:type II toxin-antitoxin system YafQ family toxin [Candidatus Neomarinimicrobiota bacterium]